jgi:hypothetical protein
MPPGLLVATSGAPLAGTVWRMAIAARLKLTIEAVSEEVK